MVSCVLPFQAAEQPSFDYTELKNTMTVCEKKGVVWAVHYGKNKQGYVVYAIFNKGKGPSPVSPSNTLKSDGSNETALSVEIDGKKVPTPDPDMNSMVIEDGKVKRGKFKPLPLEAFRKFLLDQASLTVDSLEGISKHSVDESHD